MEKIIAITNQKGGVGKTTTAVNLSAAVANGNKKVLLIDMDPQGNTTSGVGLDKRKIKFSIYDVLIKKIRAEEAIIKTPFKNLSVIPSNVALSGAELELANIENREYSLKESILPVMYMFDYIFVDCPPFLGLITTNVLSLCDSIIVPIQCEFYALEGLSQLIYTIDLVKDRLNPNLKMDGVVFTMYDARTNLSLQVIENVRENLNQKIYNTIIPRSVRLAEAPSYGLPINIYDRKSTGAKAYRALQEEIIEKGDEE